MVPIEAEQKRDGSITQHPIRAAPVMENMIFKIKFRISCT